MKVVLNDLRLRKSVLSAAWVGHPLISNSQKTIFTKRSELTRQVVAQAFPRQTVERYLDYAAKPTIDERYVAASCFWWFHIFGPLTVACPAKTAREKRIYLRFGLCPPVGLSYPAVPTVVEGPKGRPVTLKNRWPCCVSFCPHCFARRVGLMYVALRKAFSRRPPGAQVWAAVKRDYGKGSFNRKYLDKIRAAAAVSLTVPAATPAAYTTTTVFLVDDRTRAKGVKFTPVRNQWDLVRYLARNVRYPARLAFGVKRGVRRYVAEFKALVARTEKVRQITTFGAARPEYTPGLSWLDFVGHAPAGYTPPALSEKGSTA